MFSSMIGMISVSTRGIISPNNTKVGRITNFRNPLFSVSIATEFEQDEYQAYI